MSSREINPFELERRDTTAKSLMREEEPAHDTKLEKLYPHAVELVKAHNKSRVVGKVEELLRRHGSYENFPEGAAQDLADNVYGSGEVEMIENIARVLEAEKGKGKIN
jgi:hypothetical protein